MTAALPSLVTLLPAGEDTVTTHLQALTPADWQPVAELFDARLPHFDAVITLPDSRELAEQVAQLRGVPLLLARADHLTGPAVSGEAVLLTLHLGSSEPIMQAIAAAQARGLSIGIVGAATERTNLSARQHLAQRGVIVRAALQLADTPRGLQIERRNPDHWTAGV